MENLLLMNRYLGLAIILVLFANTAAASATQDGILGQTAPDSGATEQTQLLKAIDAFPLFKHESSGATLRLPSNPMRMEKAAPGGEDQFWRHRRVHARCLPTRPRPNPSNPRACPAPA